MTHRRREEAKILARAATLDLREISHEEGGRNVLFDQSGEEVAMMVDVKAM